MVSLILSQFTIHVYRALMCMTFVFLYFSLGSICRGADNDQLVTQKLTSETAAH